jgi:hypothetical protein
MTQQLFSLYAIYALADGDDGERFDTQLLPIDLAEGVRIENFSGCFNRAAFKKNEHKIGTHTLDQLENVRCAKAKVRELERKVIRAFGFFTVCFVG